jgi:hypothetical protein
MPQNSLTSSNQNNLIKILAEENKEIDIAKQSNIFPASPAVLHYNPFVHPIETVNLEPQSEKNHTCGSQEEYETITHKP